MQSIPLTPAAILFALVALNWWATRRVMAAPDEPGARKRLLIAGIWIIPFMGALIARNQTMGATVAEAAQASTGPHEAAPETIAGPGATVFSIADHIAVANGVPMLDWRALDEWARAHHTDEDLARVIGEGHRAWLLHLRDSIGPQAHLHVTDDAFVLSTLEPRTAEATANYIATAKRRVGRVLGDLARFPRGTRSILVVLDSPEDYYHYVSIFYPAEGEFAFSGGMFIDEGCPHFVVVRAELSSVEPVIAHELTHSALAHLRPPRWLDEGIAVNTEQKVAGAQRLLHTPHELHRMHLRFWNPERIQEFWSGASFFRTDDGNLLSYELARIIVEQMAREWDRFAEFASSAKRDDAGEAAALQALSTSLGAYASALVETDCADAWAPAPQRWEHAQSERRVAEPGPVAVQLVDTRHSEPW